MVTRIVRSSLLLAVLLVPGDASADASADGYVSPFLGANFGGSVGTPLREAARDRNRATFGVALGAMGGGIFGVELDVAYTANFYTQGEAPGTGSNLLTLVPTIIVGIPIGGQQGAGLRPYLVAGAGMLRRDVHLGSLASVTRSDLAYALGGGVMGFFSDRLGVRGDLRYYRNFQVDDVGLRSVDFTRGTFNVGRASIGLIVRF